MQIHGRRICLRDWQPEDLRVWESWQHGDQAWKKLDAPYYKKPDADETKRYRMYLEQKIENGSFKHPRHHLVIADGESDRLIGTVTCYWESEETQWLSLGILIFDPQHWGKGLGYEAVGLWTDYLFISRPQLVRLGLVTWSGNGGMMRLAEKLHYQLEARIRMARVVGKQYYDSLSYGILKSEWKAAFPNGFGAALFEKKSVT